MEDCISCKHVIFAPSLEINANTYQCTLEGCRETQRAGTEKWCTLKLKREENDRLFRLKRERGEI